MSEENSLYNNNEKKYDEATDPIKGLLGGLSSIANKIRTAHENNANNWRQKELKDAQERKELGMELTDDNQRAIKEVEKIVQTGSCGDIVSSTLKGIEEVANKVNEKHTLNARRFNDAENSGPSLPNSKMS